jgi:hypothetical protein
MKGHALLNILVVISSLAALYFNFVAGGQTVRPSTFALEYLIYFFCTWNVARLRNLTSIGRAGQTIPIGLVIIGAIYLLFWSVQLNFFFGLYAFFGTRAHLSDLKSFLPDLAMAHAAALAAWRLDRSYPLADMLAALNGCFLRQR